MLFYLSQEETEHQETGLSLVQQREALWYGSSSPNEESGNLGSYPAWVTDSLGSPRLLWDSASVGSHHFTNCKINGLVCSHDSRAWLYVGITWGTYKTKQNKRNTNTDGLAPAPEILMTFVWSKPSSTESSKLPPK